MHYIKHHLSNLLLLVREGLSGSEVGVRFIEPAKPGLNKFDPYIKNNDLFEKVLSFELQLLVLIF